MGLAGVFLARCLEEGMVGACESKIVRAEFEFGVLY
jgi:hypothetical protein